MSAVLTLVALSNSAEAANSYDRTVERVEAMTSDAAARDLVRRHGLGLVNVTWEDTARYKDSASGPNITDMTIGTRDSAGLLHPMPVIRFDNFSDRTADIRSDRFWMVVGNEDGARLHAVSLQEVLRNTERYLSLDDGDIAGSLWSPRDQHVLVSAQAAFLPIPVSGEATFTPVVYNYQSRPDHPAVLTIVATREGTSIQVVENEGGYLSEPLFFNEDGQRAPFSAVRLSELQRGVRGGPAPTEADGLGVVMVVQVPLKHEAPRRSLDAYAPPPPAKLAAPNSLRRDSSDVEDAVVSHGAVEGPFPELDGLTIERDPAFPVRVTVQFYKATTNGVVSDADVAAIRQQIDRVYREGDYVGSLVTSERSGRPTDWTPPPPRIWADPWFMKLSPG